MLARKGADPTSVAHHCSGAGGLSMNDRRIRGLRWVVLTRLVLAIAGLTMVTGSCMSQNEQYAPWDAGLSFPAASDTPQTDTRSEEHTSALQSLMRISTAVFCLKKKTLTSIHI